MKFLFLGLGSLICLSVANADSTDGCKNFIKNAIAAGCNELPDEEKEKCNKCRANAQESGIKQCLIETGIYTHKDFVNYKPCFDLTDVLGKINIDEAIEKGASCFPDENPCEQMGSINIEELIERAKKERPTVTEDQKQCFEDVKKKHGQAKVDEFMGKNKKIKFKGIGRHSVKVKTAYRGILRKLFDLQEKDIKNFDTCMVVIGNRIHQ